MQGKKGADAIKGMMNKMRSAPPAIIDGITVEKMRDFETSQEFTFVHHQAQAYGKLALPKSDVLQFTLVDGTKVSVRPSGTEPKIKFYISVKDPAAKGASLHELQMMKTNALKRLRRIEEIFVGMAKS
jgi:phosphoglucomutase